MLGRYENELSKSAGQQKENKIKNETKSTKKLV